MADRLSRERIAKLRDDVFNYLHTNRDSQFWRDILVLLDAYEAPRWTHNEDICREHRLWLVRIADRHREARDCLLALVLEVGRGGVELDDPRVPYVTVQIDRETWQAIQECDNG